MSLSYTIIISGLLVKVLNTWRLMIIKNSSQQLKLSSPSALLFISSGLVFLQLVLTIIWLFSFPPNPGLHDGVWKCSSSQSMILFDSEIIVSLLYVMLLLLITIFFSALTWKCYDQNREPRWIMVCGLSTIIIWLFWLFFGGIYFEINILISFQFFYWKIYSFIILDFIKYFFFIILNPFHFISINFIFQTSFLNLYFR
jgi:metabotropic glutamate receptor 2/3